MKTTHTETFMNRPYMNVPNAATRRQVLHLAIDRILVGVCCVGLTTVILFFLTLA